MTKDSSPKISVVIPTFNQANYLAEALESVFHQTYRDFEVIVVDDGSTDGTQALLSRYNSKIRCFIQPNGGRAGARNTGLKEAKGDYIAFLDSDDIWKEDRLERSLQALEKVPAAGLIHGEVEAIDFEGSLLREKTDKIKKVYQIQRKKPTDYHLVLERYAIFSSTVLFRKSCLETVGLYDSRFGLYEDYDWYLRFALNYPIHLMEGPPVAQYRIHEGNVSSQYDPETIAQIYIAILEKQLTLINQRYTGCEYRRVRSRILSKLAEFHAANHEKQEVRNRLMEALRLDPTAFLDLHSLKRLLFSFF